MPWAELWSAFSKSSLGVNLQKAITVGENNYLLRASVQLKVQQVYPFWVVLNVMSDMHLCEVWVSALLHLSDPMRSVSEERWRSEMLWLWMAVETGVLPWLLEAGVCTPVLVPMDLDRTFSLCEEDLCCTRLLCLRKNSQDSCRTRRLSLMGLKHKQRASFSRRGTPPGTRSDRDHVNRKLSVICLWLSTKWIAWSEVSITPH